jgi:plastocyanin
MDLRAYANSSGFISVSLDEFNLRDSTNDVPLACDWPSQGADNNPPSKTTSAGPGDCNVPYVGFLYPNVCTQGPDGFAILQGNYSASNFYDITALNLYEPYYVSCVQDIHPLTRYEFSPLSTQGIPQDSNGTAVSFVNSPSVTFSSYGYWQPGVSSTAAAYMNSTFVPFLHTYYTIYAADEWGNFALLRFKLSGTTSFPTLKEKLCHAPTDGSVYLKPISLQGPPIQNMTIVVNHTGASIGNFYCGGGSYSVTGYSASQGYVKISGYDNQPTTGTYGFSLDYNGRGGADEVFASPYTNEQNASVYATITLPSFDLNWTVCYHDSPCAATGVTSTSSCSSTSAISTSISPETTYISLDNFTQYGAPIFSPANVTVTIGVNNTVTWVFPPTNGGFPHVIGSITWISGPACGPTFDSGQLPTGASFTFTFTVPGTYVYESVPHGGTKGVIIVGSP